MTPTATYIAEENCLQELPQWEAPRPSVDGIFGPYAEIDRSRMIAYKKHLATLRKIPCDTSCKGLWADGQKVVEGKDYEVRCAEVDIYAELGTKVKANFCDDGIYGGYDHHKAHAEQYLERNVIYEIDRKDIGGWHTDFYLKEFPGVAFNSVHFIYPEPIAFPLVPAKSEDERTGIFSVQRLTNGLGHSNLTIITEEAIPDVYIGSLLLVPFVHGYKDPEKVKVLLDETGKPVATKLRTCIVVEYIFA